MKQEIERFARIIETATHQVLYTLDYDEEDDENKIFISSIVRGARVKVSITCGDIADGKGAKALDKITVEHAEDFIKEMEAELSSIGVSNADNN